MEAHSFTVVTSVEEGDLVIQVHDMDKEEGASAKKVVRFWTTSRELTLDAINDFIRQLCPELGPCHGDVKLLTLYNPTLVVRRIDYERTAS